MKRDLVKTAQIFKAFSVAIRLGNCVPVFYWISWI